MPQFSNAQQAMGFVTDQTKAINATVYKSEYPDHNYAELVPVDSSAPEWSTGMVTYLTDYAGAAQFISGMGGDMPLVSMQRGKVSVDYELAALGYDFTLEEINQAAMLGMNLTSDYAEAAREGAQQMLYSLAMVGNTSKNMTGLCNASGVTYGNVALNGGATSRLWADKTAAEILTDIDSLLTGTYTSSLTVELPDTLLVSPERLAYLNSQTMSSTNSETILSFIKRTNIYTLLTGQELMIRAVRQLSTAGASGSQRMVAYKRSPRTLKFHLPMPHKFLPIWQNGPMNFLVPGIMRTGGVEILKPGAMRYADAF